MKKEIINNIITIGNVDSFAFRLGKIFKNDFRDVEIFVNGENLSTEDKQVNLPVFVTNLMHTLKLVETHNYSLYQNYFDRMSVGEMVKFIESTRNVDSVNFDIEDDFIYPHHIFLDWGETTDNISSFIVPYNNKIYITYEFWRESEDKIDSNIRNISSIEISLEEIISTLRKTILCLQSTGN